MKSNVRIESDGTVHGTRVLVVSDESTEVELEGVMEVHWEMVHDRTGKRSLAAVGKVKDAGSR